MIKVFNTSQLISFKLICTVLVVDLQICMIAASPPRTDDVNVPVGFYGSTDHFVAKSSDQLEKPIHSPTTTSCPCQNADNVVATSSELYLQHITFDDKNRCLTLSLQSTFRDVIHCNCTNHQVFSFGVNFKCLPSTHA